MINQEQDEIWLMEIFLNLYTQTPLRILGKQESPDFIAESLGKKIGIEVTEVFQDSHVGWSRLQQHSSDAASFTKQLIAELQPLVDFTFSVGIHFNRFHPIRKSAKKQLIKRIKEVCVPSMLNLRDRQYLNFNYYHNLPAEIDRINIGRFDKMSMSFDSKPEGGSVSDLTIEHIKPIINKKEGQIIDYSPCDIYWLIIREGNYYAGSFDEIKIQLPIISYFDKVFLIRTRTSQLIELK